MSEPEDDGGAFRLVRRAACAAALAQALYWLYAKEALGLGLWPLNVIFLCIVLPALILSAKDEAAPLCAGLAAGAFALNIGLLALLGAG
jgi:hypothetical protein